MSDQNDDAQIIIAKLSLENCELQKENKKLKKENERLNKFFDQIKYELIDKVGDIYTTTRRLIVAIDQE